MYVKALLRKLEKKSPSQIGHRMSKTIYMRTYTETQILIPGNLIYQQNTACICLATLKQFSKADAESQ